MDIYLKIYPISIFFQVFDHDFIIYIDFTCIATSNTAIDDVIYEVTQSI